MLAAALSKSLLLRGCSTCLQAFAGIVTVSVGHCHPEVLQAIHDQNELLQHTTTIYLNHQVCGV